MPAKKTVNIPAPVKVTQLGAHVSMLKLSPLELEFPATEILEIYGEPQAGKTFYGIWLCKQLAEQKNDGRGILIIRCEKFDSEMVKKTCELFGVDADVIDLLPPYSVEQFLHLFAVKISYEVDKDSGRVSVSLLSEDPLADMENSILKNYSIVFVDTITSIFNVITSAGLKNYPARNMYEAIAMTLIELLSKKYNTTFVLTHEHSKDTTKYAPPVEIKGGKEVERRSDYIVRIAASGMGENKHFYLYAKRWPLLPEGSLIGILKYSENTFRVAK